MIDTTYMRTWAEIDLDALAHNYRALRAMLPVGCRFLGLCKANAYGHGADRIGPELERLGADILAVACVDEAIQLRRSGVSIPILCLGQTPAELTGLLLEHQVTQTVENLEAGKALSAAASAVGGKLKIHVKVDTGM
ncbi:MAG: alanine racemase, partial [Clostridium sp.]|nr:alanine racemase [Clostridium sp.]